MRVLTFLHSFEPGGVERVALRLVRQWRKMGVEAPLFVGRHDGALHSESQDLTFSSASPSALAAGFETLWMIWHLPAVIRKVQPDVLFCAGNTYTVVAVFMKFILGRNCPPIVTKVSNELVLSGLSPLIAPFYRAWAWLQTRFIEGWVVMHPSMTQNVGRHVGGGRITVIPDPALNARQVGELQFWRPPPVPRRGRRFLAIGRLATQKNYPLMLRAFAGAAAGEDRLTIFGEGNQRASLESLATSLGIMQQVTFAGYAPDPWESLMDHDALLLSSSYEGIPAVLLEAMTTGMAIVATDSGAGVRGLLAEYPGAIVCAAGDCDGFGRAIRHLSVTAPSKCAGAFDPDAYTVEGGSRHYLEAFAAAHRRSAPQFQPAMPTASAGLVRATARPESDLEPSRSNEF